jgi:hypothetical protein
MATGEPEKVVKLWMKRIRAADKARQQWEDLYEVVRCREYWAGIQRDDPVDSAGDRKAQVNRIMPTIRARIPSLYFYYPFARIVASPAKSDTQAETVDDKAQLIQDTANALLRDPRCGLKEQTLIALKEAHWAFGCIEVGYSADFIDNPALKDAAPPLKEDERTEGVGSKRSPSPPMTGMMGHGMMGYPGGTETAARAANQSNQSAEPSPYKKVVSEEWFWTRRIPPRQVIVSCPESTTVEELDWVGYWEFQHVEDVKKAPAYSNKADLKGSGGEDAQKQPDYDASSNDVKLFKVWDQRAKCRYVFAEGHDKCLLKQEYERLPLFFLRFEVEPDKFRPIPPIYSLLGVQDEYNDSREFLRMQRKTRVPRYTVAEEGVLPEEMQKFEDNQPNVWIKRRQNTAGDVISPVMQPALSDSALQSLTLSRQEFDELSGVGAEARQQAGSQTATQASIMNQRQTIQDSFDRYTVAQWLAQIIRELVLLAIDKMTLPRWITMNSDQFSPAFQQDAMVIAGLHREITLQNLQDAHDDMRWDVSVDVESLSPVSEQEKQAQWMQALNLISNPAVAPLLAMSEPLLKRTLDLNGIKNAKDQGAIQQALAMKAQMEMQAMQAQQGGPPGVAPMPGAPTGPGGPGPAAPQPPQMIPGPPEGMSTSA